MKRKAGQRASSKSTSTERIEDVPVEKVLPRSDQPRQHFDDTALAELAQSIGQDGQTVRALVRRHPSKRNAYELIDGERRWRAIQLLPDPRPLFRVIVVAEQSDDEAFRASFVANLHRRDLHRLDTAHAMKRLIEQGRTVAEIARQVGREVPYVYDHLSLLELHADVQKLLDPTLPTRAQLSYSAAVAIARVPKERQPALAKFALKRTTRLAHLINQVDKVWSAAGNPPKPRRKRGNATLSAALSNVDAILATRFATWEDVAEIYVSSNIDPDEIEEMACAVRNAIASLALFQKRMGLAQEARERDGRARGVA